MILRVSLFFFICTFVMIGCSRKLSYTFLSSTTDVSDAATEVVDKREFCNCDENEAYIPDEEFPQVSLPKIINVNLHFMNSSDRKNMFSGDTIQLYSEKLIEDANRRLGLNPKMNLPPENNTPNLNPNYRYEIVKDEKTKSGLGIYEHLDDELFYFVNKGKNRNNYNKDVIKKYAINEDSILNIFIMSHHPDSLASPTYSGGGTGIALGTSLKIAGLYEGGLNKFWSYSTLLNHEIGHVFGLKHSWYKNDDCDDTPPHKNCWSETGKPPCDGPQSNNMMDYNNSQMAITPCQIGVVNRHISRMDADVRGLVKQRWCTYDPSQSITITDTVHWNRSIDMEGDIIVADGGHLTISCRLHMPKGAKISVAPQATLRLNGCMVHNNCNEEWNGIELQSKGKEKANLIMLGLVKLLNVKGQNERMAQ